MANWILSCGTKLMPIIDLLKHDINKANYVCSDETTINVLSNNKSTNYMWLHMSGQREQRAIVYEYHQSRSGSIASDFLHDKAGVTGVGCLAHARRKFMDILKITKKPGIASTVVNIMSELYKIEQDIKDLNPEQIYNARQDRAKPIINKLKQTLLHVRICEKLAGKVRWLTRPINHGNISRQNNGILFVDKELPGWEVAAKEYFKNLTGRYLVRIEDKSNKFCMLLTKLGL